MKVLFVVSDLFYSEPLGAMMLSGKCKRHGHDTRLAVIRSHNLAEILESYEPDVIAYSAMTSDEYLFKQADQVVRDWSIRRGKGVPRIMGGPHPTYFPDVLYGMNLDAICVGDGDLAMPRMLEAIESGSTISGIPNVATKEHPFHQKEVVEDLDSLPYADRDLIYDADPDLLKIGIRSFLTQKGCPYKCTYCFNHAYNKMFKGDGRKILRRRSVDNLLDEIKQVVRDYPKARILRFADDVFVIRSDSWLEEFAERFPKEIGLPFYCLIRCNALTEDVAKLLSQAGCRSIGMSIESGSEAIRNGIMKRNMPDDMVAQAFYLARKYKLNAYANTIIGVPGTTLDDDFNSYLFAKKMKAAAPTFGIFCPYPGTDMTDYALRIGVLDKDYDFNAMTAVSRSLMNNYTEEEKEIQVRLAYLASLFCKLPGFMDPVLRRLLRLPLTGIYNYIGAAFTSYLLSTKCFPGGRPRDPILLAKSILRAIKFFMRRQSSGTRGVENRGLKTPTIGVTSPDY